MEITRDRTSRLDRHRPATKRAIVEDRRDSRPLAVVTGGAGFLGSHLVDRLLEQTRAVIAIDNLSSGRIENLSTARASGRLEFRQADVSQISRLPPAGLYAHFASPASPPRYLKDPLGTLWANAKGTGLVLESARKHDARVLIASTSEIYGDPQEHPQRESYWGHVNPTGPRSCYDEGKRFAEALAAAYRRTYSLDVRTVRIFNTYGPRMDPADGRVVSNFIVQALTGSPLTVYGDGSQTRSFCYVSDLVDGLVSLLSVESVDGPINLGNPHEITVRELAEIVERIAGVQVRRVHRPLPEDDPVQRCPDITRASSLLAWQPTVGLEDGLAKTIEDFRGRIPAAAEVV